MTIFLKWSTGPTQSLSESYNPYGSSRNPEESNNLGKHHH